MAGSRTTRDAACAEEIRAAGLDAALADPERPGSVLDQVGDVALVFWLLGSACGDPELVEAVNGPRLEALLERLVDTPVRGFVHEAAGSAGVSCLERGRRAVADAGERWRIPVASVDSEPGEPEALGRGDAGRGRAPRRPGRLSGDAVGAQSEYPKLR